MIDQNLSELESSAPFTTRHIGPTPDDRDKMVAFVGRPSLDALIDEAVPASMQAQLTGQFKAGDDD